MSDDDCDIFSSLRNDAPFKEIPKEVYNPSNDSLSNEIDLLLDRTTTKTSKVPKVKATDKAKTKGKARNSKKSLEEDDKPLAEVATGGQTEETSRSLSPVSKLMLEMEQKKSKEKEQGPVSRRTRSSLGKVEKPVPKQPSPPKRKSRAKRNEVQSISAVSANSISESLRNTVAKPRPSNRKELAELAARSTVLDSIDLASSVAPRVEGFVNLDSDDEAASSAPVEVPPAESENPPMDIALSWFGEIQNYKLRLHRRFVHMFKEVAERNNVDVDDVVIDKYDSLVEPTDTPHSIGLMKFHTLKGRAVKSNNIHKQYTVPSVLLKKANKFQLKVQGAMFKRPLVIAMKKKDTFKVLYRKCADELDCDVHLVKLFFDGELLDPEDTPKDQDMEGNEIIDLKLKT
ncbi:GL23037 [Drosophila persimilis]|uniref:GL23037 n=1 Tax=Drosophila persimilis TaxID=7234 RepID=B4G3X5_DROPE|nr:uncharacterized protein CG4449 [Drosophila persimilis]EDW25080.1 GL23037 [Drosophila persimilis]